MILQTDSSQSLSVAKYDMGYASIGSLAFFIGGFINGGTNTAVIDIFNIETGVWTTAALSQVRRLAACITIGIN